METGGAVELETAAEARPWIGRRPVQPVDLPQGPPAPVARFYQALYGDVVPAHQSAVTSGRGRMTIGGITCPCASGSMDAAISHA